MYVLISIMTKIVLVVKMKFLWFHGGADLHL